MSKKKDVLDEVNEEKKDKENTLKKKIINIWNKLNAFEKVTSILGIIVFILLCFALIIDKDDLVRVSVIQIIGITIAFLLERNIIKTNKKWIKYIILLICFLMLGTYVDYFKNSIIKENSKNKNYDVNFKEEKTNIPWDQIILLDKIPKTKSDIGKIIYNSDEKLELKVNDIAIKDFYNYIEDCKIKGYTIDIEKEEYSFKAYSADEFVLNLNYYQYTKELRISLEKIEKLGNIEWSNSELAKLLPIPKFDKGKVISDTKKLYSINIAEMNLNQFNEYIEQCKEKGFKNEIKRTDKRFEAKDDQKNKLNIEYIGNNRVTIKLEEAIYDIKLKVKFNKNIILNKYDIKMYIDNIYKADLLHGESKEFELTLDKGKHKISFDTLKDKTIKGDIDLEITKDETIELKVNSNTNDISVENMTNKGEEKKEKNEELDKKIIETKTEENKNNKVDYYSKDEESAKKGNTGIYAYKKERGQIV